MPRSARALPTQTLRRILLVLLLLSILAVTGLYLFGRAGKPQPEGAAPEPVAGARETLVLAGEGFEYEVSQAGTQLFRIQAERILSEQEQTYLLEGVVLDVERDADRKYRIAGRRGTYDLNTQLATLEGEVRFDGPGETRLTSESLDLRRRGNLVVTNSPVELGFGPRFQGRADALRVDLERDDMVLGGNVVIATQPGDPDPLSVTGQRLTFDRPRGLIRTEGGVTVRRGEDVLESNRLSLDLTEDEKGIRFIRARWEVSGGLEQISADGGRGRLEFRGHELSVLFDEAGEDPQSLELDAEQGDTVSLAIRDETGLVRELVSEHLIGSFQNGELSSLDVGQGVMVVERLAAGPILRRVCASVASVSFAAGGELGRIRLLGDVDFQEAGLQALGDELESDYADGSLRVTGSPARLLSEQGGELEAPRLEYTRDDGGVRATGGVRTWLERGEVSLAIAESDREQPVRVESEEADWRPEPGTVRFKGQVRAWQGESFLLADELAVESGSSRVHASGGVRTVWRRAAAANVEGGAAAPGPVEVSAGKLLYERDRRVLTYSVAPRLHQAGRTLRSEEVRLLLTESGEIDRVSCRGKTRIEDPISGNTVTGDEADYQPEIGKVRVRGEPAILRDRQGTEIRGRTLLYDLESGTAQMQAEPREPAPPTAATAGEGSVPPPEPEPGEDSP